MTINAYANTGKSKMAYSMANNFLKNKLSVAIFSLEVTANKVMLNLLANWYKMDYNTIAK
jgi:replicative DNA helicase